MPSSLRAKTALVAIFAVLMIPLWTSSLRGLTHVLTCNQTTDTDFSIDVAPDGTASVLSSVQFDREGSSRELCDGLVVDVGVNSNDESGTADVLLSITNNSEFDWKGSVQVKLDAISIPVSIGKIAAGRTETDTIEVNLENGKSYEVKGNLLIGP